MRGTLLENALLADYSTWRVGGPARYFYQPADVSDLQEYLKSVNHDLPLLWLGLGSNCLFRDGGFPGIVIHTQGCLATLKKLDDNTIYAEAGVSCAALARFCARQNLTGAEFWAGIPGTVGGALKMNAGCFNGETWNSVISVTTIDKAGNLHERTRDEFIVHYREVEMPESEWFVAGTFKLPAGEKELSLKTIRELLDRRARTQPTGDYSCGSVFRNPPGDHAGRLIESCGLKGHRIGGAVVSEKHANFILNDQNAKARDIEELIYYVRETVAKKCGVQLHPEVHIIGEK